MEYLMLRPERRTVTEREIREIARQAQLDGKIAAEFIVDKMAIDRLILLLEGEDEYEFAD